MDRLQNEHLSQAYHARFSSSPLAFFSAPGRTELAGNHTDHQHGCGITAGISLSVNGAVGLREDHTVSIFSEGYPPFTLSLSETAYRKEERGSFPALVRGVFSYFLRKGVPLSGFNAYISSDVPPGSGLSSSAALEVLLGKIINTLFARSSFSPVEIAKGGKWAENEYFGKSSGLQDQLAIALQTPSYLDFEDEENPRFETVPFPLAENGFSLCIINSGADHADLSDAYSEITGEMKQVASFFSEAVLRFVPEEKFLSSLPLLRKEVGDRAVLRALHFFEEQKRVQKQKQALLQGDIPAFLRLAKESGHSSYMYLQNVLPPDHHPAHQALALTLALCDRFLEGKGAFRVHGGGFAGTAQAFVPTADLPLFVERMDGVLGKGSCLPLSITA